MAPQVPVRFLFPRISASLSNGTSEKTCKARNEKQSESPNEEYKSRFPRGEKLGREVIFTRNYRPVRNAWKFAAVSSSRNKGYEVEEFHGNAALGTAQYFNPARYLAANSSVYSWTCNFRSEKRIVARGRCCGAARE